MDSKFPHHPLMPSEASYKKNVEAAELNMLRKTMGAAMPLKLAMERKAASKVIIPTSIGLLILLVTDFCRLEYLLIIL